MEADWLNEIPIKLIEDVFGSIKRPLDNSIPPKRDYTNRPDVDLDRLSEIQERFLISLREATYAQFSSSWASLTPIRTSLERFSNRMKRVRNVLDQNATTIVAAIDYAKIRQAQREYLDSLDSETYNELFLQGSFPKTSHAWSLRSREHPRNTRGASPLHLVTYLGDGLADLKDAIDISQNAPAKPPSTGAILQLEKLHLALTDDVDDGAFTEALRLAAVNLLGQKLARNSAKVARAEFDTPTKIIEWMLACIDLLNEQARNLDALIVEYDRLIGPSLHPWLSADVEIPTISRSDGSNVNINDNTIEWSGSRLIRESLRHLAPFLANGRSTKPDTDLLLSLAQLYQFIFNKPFRIYARDKTMYEKELGDAYGQLTDDPNRSDKPRALGVLDYEINEAMKFACCVIKTFKLEAVIFGYGKSDMGWDPAKHGPRNSPTGYDIKRHQRLQWAIAPRKVRDFDLVCKLGDLWKHIRQRNRTSFT